MSNTRSWGYALGGLLAVTMAAPAFAQPQVQDEPAPSSGQQAPSSAQQAPSAGQQSGQTSTGAQAQTGTATPSQKQLSQPSQDALARLYALSEARASFARTGAEMAQDDETRSFLRSRAMDYEQAQTRLKAFAKTYGVDLQSEQMQRKTRATLSQWDKENDKLRNAKPEQAARTALSTFIQRNSDAIDDLRQVRGDVQEDELRQMINQRIASLEEESTRAQQLRKQLAPQSPQQGAQGEQGTRSP